MFSIVRRFGGFITVSVRFKGENLGRSVELKQIPDVIVKTSCYKIM